MNYHAPTKQHRSTSGWQLPLAVLAVAAANLAFTTPLSGCEQAPAAASLGPSTDSLMMSQPPFTPGCFPGVSSMQDLGCPLMDCSQDASCSVHNTSCCVYFNYQMLDFLDRFLTAHCLQQEYMLVYGSLLGAVRETDGILAHTEDVDLGLSPLAIQFLELNSTKELLWRHGYTFWFNYPRRVWKVCPHLHHPSPHFQTVMLKNTTLAAFEQQTGRQVAAYVDGWLMWRVPGATHRCSGDSLGPDFDTLMATPWDNNSTALSTGADACSLQHAAAAHNSTPAVQTYCVSESDVPHRMQPGSRTARVAGRNFPMPQNYEEIMAETYGASWRTPDLQNHGQTVRPLDEGSVRLALVDKLSRTAWASPSGGMSWLDRLKACKAQAAAPGR